MQTSVQPGRSTPGLQSKGSQEAALVYAMGTEHGEPPYSAAIPALLTGGQGSDCLIPGNGKPADTFKEN